MLSQWNGVDDSGQLPVSGVAFWGRDHICVVAVEGVRLPLLWRDVHQGKVSPPGSELSAWEAQLGAQRGALLFSCVPIPPYFSPQESPLQTAPGITEPRAEVSRDLWRSSCPTPLLKKGHQDQITFEYLQAWRLHIFPRQPAAVLGHLHSKWWF